MSGYVDPTEQLVIEVVVKEVGRSVDFYRLDFVELTWACVSKVCSSSPIASTHCGRCVVFFASEVGWPSRCGAPSATHRTTRPSLMRWRDT